MRRLVKVSLSLALVALLASPALAQQRQRQRQRQPGGGFGGGFGQNLLLNKSVQEELKLTKEQQDKLTEAGKGVQEKMREAMQGLRDLQPEERMQKMAALRKETGETLAKAAELTSKQSARLKEIELQQGVRTRGLTVFNEADVQKKLNLTDEQKSALKTIVTETQEKIQEETKDLDRMDFQKRNEIRTKLNKEAMSKFASKLTADQKKTWAEMMGEPFEVKFERPMRRGGGRPGGGGRPPR
jgi:hypothetical protein